MIPTISITPPALTNTPPRLLYRGALSVPSSHLLLDGLTFLASGPVLQNPLALALESMRGRPSLQLIGRVSMAGVWVEEEGVIMDIHPYATLSRIYFENVFCLSPIATPDGKSEHGVRVALGESDGPEPTEIIIYASLSSASPSPSPQITLRIARISPTPPLAQAAIKSTSHLRLPRPDDPTPRLPPRILSSTSTSAARSKLTANTNTKGKGKRGQHKEDESTSEQLRRAREVMLFGRAARPRPQPREGTFKVPDVPKAKDKGKRRADIELGGGEGTHEIENEIEKNNKTLLKQLTLAHLASASIPRGHSDFKELFGWVYRGAGFLLRDKMKTHTLDPQSGDVQRAVKVHVELYVPIPGSLGGGSSDAGFSDRSAGADTGAGAGG